MPYEYLDHTADLGLRATGATPQEALSEGAQAMLDAMAGVLFASAHVTELRQEEDSTWVLRGIAKGEPLDPHCHEVHTEIKGATYYGLEYGCSTGRCVVQCVLDV